MDSDADSNASNEDSDSGVDELLRAIAHAPPRPVPVDLALGGSWGQDGRYLVERRLGRGGMGVVYVARDTLLGRDVAIKLLEVIGDDPAAYRRRLLREAQLAARVEHDRLARVYDVGQFEGAPFIAMELVRGSSLREWMAGAPRAAPQVMAVLQQVAEGLAALHAVGLVHRDLKPENVMVASGDQIKLVDFGLARLASDGEPGSSSSAEGARTGVGGTPGYMAPELGRGAPVDARIDVFAFGVLFFELVTGALPFNRAPSGQDAAAQTSPPSFAHAGWSRYPEAARALVARALQAEPARRHRDAAMLLEELRRLTTRRNKRGLVVGVALAATLVTGLAAAEPWSALRPARPAPPGMVAIEGGRYTVGRSDAELDAECRELGKACDREVLQREAPKAEVNVGRFFIDADELTNERAATWLNALTGQLTVLDDSDDHFPRYVRWEKGHDRVGEVILDLHPDASGIEYVDRKFRARAGKEQLPLILVTWYGARSLCSTLGKRLPTENEWEIAARGKADRRFPWANEAIRCGEVAVPSDGNIPMLPCAGGEAAARNVGTAAQDVTPEGVRDLGGNISEWVDGAYVEGDRQAVTAPPDAPRVIRGGSYAESDSARTSARTRRPADTSAPNVGLRCAADG